MPGRPGKAAATMPVRGEQGRFRTQDRSRGFGCIRPVRRVPLCPGRKGGLCLMETDIGAQTANHGQAFGLRRTEEAGVFLQLRSQRERAPRSPEVPR